jgi:hypothetical protein
VHQVTLVKKLHAHGDLLHDIPMIPANVRIPSVIKNIGERRKVPRLWSRYGTVMDKGLQIEIAKLHINIQAMVLWRVA